MKKPMFEFNGLTSLEVFESLPKKEQEIINGFRDYVLVSASPTRAEEGKREIIRYREVTGKELDKNELEDLHYFLKELKNYGFAEHSQNKIKGYVQRFLKWKFRDWNIRFNELKDIKFNGDAQNKKPINSKTIFTREEIMKMLDYEKKLYWKTFLIVQYEAGLRTGEARKLRWDNITFEQDGYTILEIESKKNRNGTIKNNSIPTKISGNFLKELKNQQKDYGIDSPYVFPSPQNSQEPISKAVNLWFRRLCKEVLGREGNNYLLRHSKGTELQEKIRKGELSKDNAVQFMRHSEKMFDKVYSHLDKKDILDLMKKQIFDKNLTEQEKNEIDKMNERIFKLEAGLQTALALLNENQIQDVESYEKVRLYLK